MRIAPINTKTWQYNIQPVFKSGSPSESAYRETDVFIGPPVTNPESQSSVYNKKIVEEIGADGQKYIFLEERKLKNKNDLIKADDQLSIYFKQVKKYPLLSQEEELVLTQKLCESHDEKARQLLINSNLRFVIFVAKKYIGNGLSLLDLIQEGNEGLVRAADKFDYTLGYRFCSFAVNCIESSIKNAIKSKSRTVRIPIAKQNQLYKIKNAVAELSGELGRTPSEQEIADKLNMPVSNITSVLKSAQSIISLDEPIKSDEKSKTMMDFIASEPDTLYDDSNDLNKMRLDYIEKVFSQLNPIEQGILNLGFGLHNEQTKSLQEIAAIYGLSRQRISQIKQQALEYIRKRCKVAEQIRII